MDVKDKDIWEFFSFSGPIHYFVTLDGFLCSEGESTKHAFVTYKDSQGAETAALLTVCKLITSFWASKSV